MRLRDTVDRASLIELARASETSVGRAYRTVIEAKSLELMARLRKKPKINPVDAKEDVRYLFGFLDGLDYLIGLEEEALSEISKPQSAEEEERDQS